MPDLLLELFSEEIPARMQARAAEDLKRLVSDRMVENGLTYSGGRAFATPRRLTLALSDLPAETPDTVEERKGPRTDAPEKALEGFLRSTGLTRDDLEARDDKKGQVWFATIRRPGRPAAEVVAEAVEHAVRNFPWPKSMRWGSGSLRWVRPLHSILCILHDETGAATVPLTIDGIEAGNTTRGHRFHAPEPFAVTSFDDYAQKLEAARVVLDPADRAARIEADARNLAFASGLDLVEDPGLLAEVAGLVEWPVTLMGAIAEEFLDLPPEVLQTSMKEHQKFFSVRNPATGRIERFITVANTQTPDDGATILAGNLKVLNARLSDAKFFWENDLRMVERGGMAALAAPLANVTFHAKLGTQAERVARIEALAREIAPAVGAKPDLAAEAAAICKADLTSQMVYEFPELQGTMGRYYAARAGHDDGVPEACETHYSPLGPSDDVPSDPVAVAVALADKIDMAACLWANYEKPTGSKDPLALRRAGIGVVRTLLENEVRVRLSPLIQVGYEAMRRQFLNRFNFFVVMTNRGGKQVATDILRSLPRMPPAEANSILCAVVENADEMVANQSATIKAIEGGQIKDYAQLVMPLKRVELEMVDFIADRLKVHLRDEGIRHDVIQACFDLGGQDDLVLLVNRVRALQDFLATDDGTNLLIAYRRAANIVTAEQKKDGVEYSADLADVKYADQPEETALFQALDSAAPAIAKALEQEDFPTAMTRMAALRAPIDAFFDKVTVNADNDILRRNRLCLLTRIAQVLSQVAVWDAIEG